MELLNERHLKNRIRDIEFVITLIKYHWIKLFFIKFQIKIQILKLKRIKKNKNAFFINSITIFDYIIIPIISKFWYINLYIINKLNILN